MYSQSTLKISVYYDSCDYRALGWVTLNACELKLCINFSTFFLQLAAIPSYLDLWNYINSSRWESMQFLFIRRFLLYQVWIKPIISYSNCCFSKFFSHTVYLHRRRLMHFSPLKKFSSQSSSQNIKCRAVNSKWI